VFASQFARLFPAELGAQYLDAACQVVEAQEAGIPVKISAIKAIQKYDREFSAILHLLTTHTASRRRWTARS
jgi:hypothetical protein